MKRILLIALAILILVGGIYFFRASDNIQITGFSVKEAGQENILTGNVVLDSDPATDKEAEKED
ncbi:MAG: hypothetical protein AABW87_03490, partial [Nanoarchaeota archaeon]